MNIKEEKVMNVINTVKNSINIQDAIKKQAGKASSKYRENSVSKTVNPIEWNDYNYPPMLRLYHYQTNGVKEPTLGIIVKMKWCADLIIIVSILNLINNISQMFSDCPLIKGRQVIYSILNILIWPTAAHYSFY